MITHNYTRTWSANGEQISKALALTGNGEIAVDMSVPALTVNQLVSFAAVVANIQGLYLVSSLAMTVKTNSAGSPANTFTLAANVPFMWAMGDAALRDTAGALVSANITALYVSNADATNAALLEIRLLNNP